MVKVNALLIFACVSSLIFSLTLQNGEFNAICHLLPLLGDHHILHVSRIRVNMPCVCIVAKSEKGGEGVQIQYVYMT
jgi:hypothetical protein